MSRVTSPHIRFTVDEVSRLVEANAFGSKRIELVNGRIYRMAPQAVPHMLAITRGVRAISRVAAMTDWVIGQGTLRLDRHSAPDPDILWLPVPEGTAAHEWPNPVLLIEVSSSTYRRDSGIKRRTYAFHGISDYWIENLAADQIEVYRDPRNPTGKLRDCTYAAVEVFHRGQTIPVLNRPGVTLNVDDLLP